MIATSTQYDKVTELSPKEESLSTDRVVMTKREVIDILKTLEGLKRKLQPLVKE